MRKVDRMVQDHMNKRILIVGLGSMGKVHLSVIQGLFPEAKIKILRQGKRRDETKLGLNEISSLIEARQFLPDIIVICNPASEHINIALKFIDSGANIFIEKPISHSTKEIAQLISALEATNGVLMVGYNLRYLESLQAFRKHLREGLIGEPLSVRCEVGQYLPSWRPKKDYRESVSAKRELGGGVLLELSHEIDYLRWIFGEVDWVRATLLQQSELEIDVEDTVHLTIGFEKRFSNRQLIANLNMDFIRHDTRRCCTVIGNKGSLHWDGILGEVSIFRAGEKTWQTLFTNDNGIQETYTLEWQELVRAIEEKRSPWITGEDGLRVVEIIEAARLSNESGIQTAVIRSPIKNEALN
jgi:predicted dehydrogenase